MVTYAAHIIAIEFPASLGPRSRRKTAGGGGAALDRTHLSDLYEEVVAIFSYSRLGISLPVVVSYQTLRGAEW